MADEPTTIVVERYLHELAGLSGDAPAEPVIRALLASSVRRLHQLCDVLLHRSYPRLTRPPLNLQAEEMLSGVVERMIKAMRVVRPGNVRQFFALVNRHMRWELNDLARRFDNETRAVELRESAAVGGRESVADSQLTTNARRMLEAIDALPEQEREVFGLVRIQGMTHVDAAAVIGVSVKTVQRRLNRSLLVLGDRLADLNPAVAAHDTAPGQAQPSA